MHKKTGVMPRVNKDEIVDIVALKTGTDKEIVRSVLRETVDAVTDLVMNGNEVSIMGFGKFYKQLHKGHPVQFGDPDEKIKDYYVFKFSTSNVVNDELRETEVGEE